MEAMDDNVSIPSQAGILLAESSGWNARASRASVSIPSQAGILLAASSRASTLSADFVSIPSQAGILLAEPQRRSTARSPSRSQYPLRRASSWRLLPPSQERSGASCLNTLSGGHPLGGFDNPTQDWYFTVSIPSQAGILLAVTQIVNSIPDDIVSIPSQAGILLAAAVGYSIGKFQITSQYPLRRASSWRVAQARLPPRTGRSQYPLRRASSWRSASAGATIRSRNCLNTLSGGHPLGGIGGKHEPEWWSWSQYPLRRASSWRVRPWLISRSSE